MKRLLIVCLAVMMSLCLSVSVSIARDKMQIKKIDPAQEVATEKPSEMMVKPMEIKPVAPKTDLAVDVIHSTSCKCDLTDVDALYMGNILVDVSNNYMQSGGAAATSTLTVKYHDLSAGPQTITKSISSLNPYPTNPWALQKFLVVNHPVLVKKSVGIRVEIQPDAPVTDSNPANNVKVEKKCAPMVY